MSAYKTYLREFLKIRNEVAQSGDQEKLKKIDLLHSMFLEERRKVLDEIHRLGDGDTGK